MLLRQAPAGQRLLSTVVDLAHIATPTVDLNHLSSVADSKSDLLKSYRVTPPIQPWPDRLHARRLVAMIRRQTDLDLAIRIFRHADAFHPGFSHNYLTFRAMIEKLARARSIPKMEQILSLLRDRCSRSPLKCGEEAFITVIRCYGVAGKPLAALKTFISIKEDFHVNTSVRSLNALLNAMIQNRRYDLVAVLFKNCSRKFGISINICTCNILLKALCKMGNLEGALKMLDEMPLWGIAPNLVTFTTLITGYCEKGDLDSARGVLDEILERGIPLDATAFTILMQGYCSKNMIADAVKIMDEMSDHGVKPSEITYSVIMGSLCGCGKSSEAVSLLYDMLDSGFLPCTSVCSELVDGLCVEGKVELAYEAWKKLVKKNFEPDGAIASTIIHWLCKEGKVWEAKELLGQLERNTLIGLLPYNAILAGLCEKGELQEAGQIWDRMEGRGFKPNGFSYGVMIKGFCRLGKAREAVGFLREMVEKGFVLEEPTCEVILDGLEGVERESVEEILGRVRDMA